MLRSVAPLAKSALKSVGKAALHTGMQVASDAIKGRNVVDALEEHGKTAASDLLDTAVTAMSEKRPVKRSIKHKRQRGRGLGLFPTTTTVKSIKGPVKRQKRDILGDYEEE